MKHVNGHEFQQFLTELKSRPGTVRAEQTGHVTEYYLGDQLQARKTRTETIGPHEHEVAVRINAPRVLHPNAEPGAEQATLFGE